MQRDEIRRHRRCNERPVRRPLLAGPPVSRWQHQRQGSGVSGCVRTRDCRAWCCSACDRRGSPSARLLLVWLRNAAHCYRPQAGRGGTELPAMAPARYAGGHARTRRGAKPHPLLVVAARPQPGYYCPPASATGTAWECGGAGFWCGAASAEPQLCQTGHYTVGTSPTTRHAQAVCPPGYFCTGDGVVRGHPRPPSLCHRRTSHGMHTLTPAAPLPAPLQLRKCPAGSYGASPGEVSPSCTGLCAAGRYGGPSFVATTPECEGACAPGFYCEAGAVAAAPSPCPSGRCAPRPPALPSRLVRAHTSRAPACVRYGAGGSSTALCDGPCSAGFACPPQSSSPRQQQCGSQAVFCATASAGPTAVAVGNYTTPTSAPSAERSGTAQCEPGFACAGDGARQRTGGRRWLLA